ncbi:MAG: hypothetical protein ACQSGP_29780 [Frankia sp.]
MPLIPVVQSCASGGCPAVYLDDDGDVVIQGDVVGSSAGIVVTGAEALVKIPQAMLLEAAQRLSVQI